MDLGEIDPSDPDSDLAASTDSAWAARADEIVRNSQPLPPDEGMRILAAFKTQSEDQAQFD